MARHHNHDVICNGSAVLSAPEDIAWLKATHLKGVRHKEFKSFVLIGNEDCPAAIYLYEMADPLVTDRAEVVSFAEVAA